MNAEFNKRLNRKPSILTAEHPYESIVMRWLLVFLAGLICGYLYFVSASVLNVIARKDAMRRTDEMTSDIATLEQRYFRLSQDVSQDTANDLNLLPVAATSYVYRPGTVGVATTRDDIQGLEI